MTINQVLAQPGLLMRERRQLLRHVLDFSDTDLFLRAERELSAGQLEHYFQLVKRRQQGEPMAYITSRAGFYGRDFLVTPDVLIPRPETELLVEHIIRLAPRRLLDVCTGSGILAISLQLETGAETMASDISPAALAVARQNGQLHQAEIDWRQGDLFESISGSFDVIVSNPPYIDETVLPELDVARYEPRLALDGGPGGLAVYQKLIPEARQFLSHGGHLVLEIGYDQAEAITQLLIQNGYDDIIIRPDLAGFDRLAQARFRRQA